MLVDFRLGLDVAGLEGHDCAVEDGEFRVSIEDVGDVDGVGVGEEDEAVAAGAERADGFPHGEVGGENFLPSAVESVVGGCGFEGSQRPVCVVEGGDAAGLEVILLFDEFLESGVRISVIRR